MKRRITVRALLRLIVAVGCILGGYVYWHDPVVHYRWFRDGGSLRRICRSLISNGDSLAKLESLVGPVPVANPRVDAWARKCLSNEPQGVQDADEIRYIDCVDCGAVYQFRRGRLVNFVPSSFD